MFTKSKQVLTRYLLVGALALIVAGCSQPSNTPPNPPKDTVNALVYGMATSPIYEALKTKLTMVPWNGSQNPTDFDLVILDGDAFGVQQLKEEELIQSAVRSGVWILGLDLTEDKKQDGLGDLLGAGTPEKSMAYLVRLTQSPNGHPVSTYIDFRDEQADATLQAQRIIEYVEGKGLQAQQNSDDTEPADPPKGALMWEHRVSQAWDIKLPRNKNPRKAGLPIQTASWTQSYQIRLYLESDSANPTGKSQWVAIEQQGDASPGTLVINYTDCTKVVPNDCPSIFSEDYPSYEVAWPQTLFVPEVAISGDLFALNSHSPNNPNSDETVTTTSSFTIGVNQAQGGFGSYTYSTSKNHKISEWKMKDDSNPSATDATASWRFASANPYDGFNTKTGSGYLYAKFAEANPDLPDPTLFYSIYPYWKHSSVNQPNDLSKENFKYATSSVWQLKGTEPSTETVFIGGTDTAWYVDAYTQPVMFRDNENIEIWAYVERYSNQHPWGLNVNLGAVVPVPFKQGGFGIKQEDGTIGNEMTAGDEVTGVVTLAAPANADAKVFLNVLTNDYGVTIPTDSTTIKQGETTGTFTIESAKLCLATNGAARLTANYGGEQLNQELTVVKPPDCG